MELDRMKESLSRLIKYNSVQGEEKPGMPFGEVPAKVLEEALAIAGEMGFKTKNLDNYCGYAEIGEGKDIIGICGHLDVVAAGEGWDSDPFTLTEREGKLYGRGVSDDKGPVVAALYALKRIGDSGMPLNKRIRLIMGCNEETGSKCMEYYNKVEEPVTVGFTPDASFPGIHGEKSLCAMLAHSKNTEIISFNGGISPNAVCERCEAVIPAKISEEALENAFKASGLVEYKITRDGDTFNIFAKGEAAHASRPLVGINAIGCTMKALEEAGFDDDFVKYYNSHIGITCDGAGYNLKIEDDYGNLTLNNGIIRMENGEITCTVDIRVPVTFDETTVRQLCAERLEDENGKTEITFIGKPLFFDPDSEFIQALYGAYVSVTGDMETKPMVIGGGTYAKSIPGIIAFGGGFPGSESREHNSNEVLDIKEWQLQVDIYVQAIRNLLAL